MTKDTIRVVRSDATGLYYAGGTGDEIKFVEEATEAWSCYNLTAVILTVFMLGRSGHGPSTVLHFPDGVVESVEVRGTLTLDDGVADHE